MTNILDRENYSHYHKIRSRDPWIFIKVSGMSVSEMKSTGSKYVNNTHFYTNSGTPIGVDNRFSGCISNIMDEFISPLVECNWVIKWLGGTRTWGLKTRTIRWEWLDNPGKRRKLLISNCYYVPQGGGGILSPPSIGNNIRSMIIPLKEKWAPYMKGRLGYTGISAIMNKLSPLDKSTNVDNIKVAPGYTVSRKNWYQIQTHTFWLLNRRQCSSATMKVNQKELLSMKDPSKKLGHQPNSG